MRLDEHAVHCPSHALGEHVHEIAILLPLGAALAGRVLVPLAGRVLVPEDLSATFGVTFYPDDGQTTSELFHKADDRLFAAKLIRQNRATVVALADRAS